MGRTHAYPHVALRALLLLYIHVRFMYALASRKSECQIVNVKTAGYCVRSREYIYVT
jgi:hypothetical protein